MENFSFFWRNAGWKFCPFPMTFYGKKAHNNSFSGRENIFWRTATAKPLILWWQTPRKKSSISAWIPLHLPLLKLSTLIFLPFLQLIQPLLILSSKALGTALNTESSASFMSTPAGPHFPLCLRECHARHCHTLNKFQTYHIICLLFIHLAGYSDKEWN